MARAVARWTRVAGVTRPHGHGPWPGGRQASPRPTRVCAHGRVAQRGLTLIELVIALAIVAMLGAMGMPSAVHALRTHQLKSAAFNLQADVARGRFEALSRGQSLHVQFRPGDHWCYALSLGAPADCTQPSDTLRAFKIVRADAHPTVRLDAATPMQVHGATGQASNPAGQVRWTSSDGQILAVQLGPMGRATVCSPKTEVGRVPPCRLPLTLP